MRSMLLETGFASFPLPFTNWRLEKKNCYKIQNCFQEVKPYFDPAVEIYLDKYKNHFPFPSFRDQEFREGEKCSVKSLPLPRFKGSLTRDFRLQVFVINQCPSAPEYPIWTISNFFENSWRYSRMNVYQRCQRHWRKKRKF
jgi:hypothetical protein